VKESAQHVFMAVYHHPGGLRSASDLQHLLRAKADYISAPDLSLPAVKSDHRIAGKVTASVPIWTPEKEITLAAMPAVSDSSRQTALVIRIAIRLRWSDPQSLHHYVFFIGNASGSRAAAISVSTSARPNGNSHRSCVGSAPMHPLLRAWQITVLRSPTEDSGERLTRRHDQLWEGVATTQLQAALMTAFSL